MSTTQNENPGCLNAIFQLFGSSTPQTDTQEALPYRLRDDFLSPAELSFYRILSTVIADQAAIFTKVRLADIFFVARPNENRSYFGRISQKHVDFLLCEPNTAKPLLGIELDDSSHKRAKRKERDEFVNQVFQAAQLPLVRLPVQRAYTTQDVLAAVQDYIAPSTAKNTVTKTPQVKQTPALAEPETSTTPLCPKCNIPMVVRTVKKGKHKGKQFYGCENYPNCRQMLSLENA